MIARPDKLTRRWIRNRSDELAVENGCWFDQDRADHVCEFFETELRLYEGESAGEPFLLMDWERELLSRAFGWVRRTEDWPRPIRRFRKVSVWVPKKNGKSPLAAGVGLYLLAADGERGQKVYSAAKDGKQAGIVHTHARKMIAQSPNLDSICHINRSTGRISVEVTDSVYDILSGDNIRGQEGLNGSVIIDETHVVDSRLVTVLEYMGASRSEPMQFEVSTAGNNPEGYGKKQFNYGRQVERGDVRDDEFLFVFYGVDEATSDEECYDEELWKVANPSWGVTIKPNEIRKSAERAKQKGISEWRDFCMYRLNRWQASSSPWLRMTDWQACSRGFDLSEVESLPCAAGLDLSKTRDMSALSVCWVEDDRRWLKVWLWITERYAEANSSKASFQQWAEDEHLTIIPGDVIRQSWIREQFEQLMGRLDLDVLAYDKTYAQEFTEWVEENWDIQLVEYPQSYALMEKPIDDFEALVRDHLLIHDGNPCLNWQAGHSEIKTNAKGHRLLCKPNADDVRKIDGMVASVMSTWGTQHVTEDVGGDLFVF